MAFVKPMLAAPVPIDFTPLNNEWVAEEKYDGHRLYVEVHGQDVKAWSRNELPRILPPHVRADLIKLPDGAYDGELISTEKSKSYGVTDLGQSDKLCFVMFDILAVMNRDTTHLPYFNRRIFIEEIFKDTLMGAGVTFSGKVAVTSNDVIKSIASGVWTRGGEGLILKNINAPYLPGKRSKSWLKIKQCQTAVLKVIGFIAGRMGPWSVVLLEDAQGNRVTVKTKNTQEREALEERPQSYVGRKLRIEFQERTPDGGYRHPMWDRWEDA